MSRQKKSKLRARFEKRHWNNGLARSSENILPNGQKIAANHRDFAISASGVCGACVKIDRHQIAGLRQGPGKALIIIMFYWHLAFAHRLIIRDHRAVAKSRNPAPWGRVCY